MLLCAEAKSRARARQVWGPSCGHFDLKHRAALTFSPPTRRIRLIPTSTVASELDDLDLRIISQLQDDGRKPSTEIARALSVPRTTIARRIERLVRDEIITIGVFAHGPKIGLP